MTWLRIDDGFAEHPKIHALSDGAFRLHVSALCYCARNLTDGHISRAAVTALAASIPAKTWAPESRQKVARRSPERSGNITRALVKAGLWESGDNGYVIHDYLAYNPSKADVERDRAAARARMQRRRSGEVRKNSSGEHKSRSGERSPSPSRPLVGDNPQGTTATWQPALGIRDPAAAIRREIANGVITDLVDLNAAIKGYRLNGTEAQQLIREFTGT